MGKVPFFLCLWGIFISYCVCIYYLLSLSCSFCVVLFGSMEKNGKSKERMSLVWSICWFLKDEHMFLRLSYW